MDNWIQTQLPGPAQVPSHDLLHDFNTVSHDLYTFISTSYEDNMHSCKFESTKYWKLTSSFFKRKFIEVVYARVSARYAIHIDVPLKS